MNPENAKHIFFLGIGGIGMSALARYFLHRGKTVSGYDKVESKLTRSLVAEGIHVFYDSNVHSLPQNIDLVVFTPAISKDFSLFVALQSRGLNPLKRSEILGQIAQNHRVIAVAGTHGKTTTAAILAHIMISSGMDCNAFIGGILSGYESNCFFGQSDWMIAEADEYDRSFLTLYPAVAIINAIDADHLDIYSGHEQMKAAYKLFADQVEELLIMPSELEGDFSAAKAPIRTIGVHNSDILLSNYEIRDGKVHFSVKQKDEKYPFSWNFPGRHNAMNAVAAIAAARYAGLSYSKIQSAIESFRGIHRRFELLLHTNCYVVINDYAHHPAELKAVISASRELYADKHITGIFQPHLYSRTRDFAGEFAEVLDLLNTCYIMEIYPARELPMKGVSSHLILDGMQLKEKYLLSDDTAATVTAQIKPGVVLILGAGNIDEYADLWCEQLKSKAA